MYKFLLIIIICSVLLSCNNEKNKSQATKSKKIGVLLVSHGSRSETWRKMLLSIEDSVKSKVLSNKNISGMKSALMEYNEPSIATRMKEFDSEGYTDVIIVPIFLTVSSHSFDDIPTIVGLKSSQSDIDKLKQERIDIYKSKAKIEITPLLDFTSILRENLLERYKKISKDVKNEGCVLVAYGDVQFDKEWTKLMNDMNNYIKDHTGITHSAHSWCGHIVHYESKPTSDAINSILEQKKNAVVLPVLVAFDEMFQIKIIGEGIEKSQDKSKVLYKPDAILPDKGVNNWVVNIIDETVAKISK